MNTQKSLIYQLGKILGFEEIYIQKLEEDYKKANEDSRYEIMDILWKYFFKLYDKLTALKYAQFFKEAAEGKRELSPTMYQEAQDEIKTYFKKILTGELEDEEKIEELRQKIAQLVKTN